MEPAVISRFCYVNRKVTQISAEIEQGPCPVRHPKHFFTNCVDISLAASDFEIFLKTLSKKSLISYIWTLISSRLFDINS